MSLMYRPRNAAARSVHGTPRTTKVVFTMAVLCLAGSTALSQNNQGQNNNDQGQDYHGTRHVSAPEIDPAQALGAVTLLGGIVAIIRGYRRDKK